MTWIQTYSGLKFDLHTLNPEMICIEDIAHALGNLCRFSGHCNHFYSVAEHSLLVTGGVALLSHKINSYPVERPVGVEDVLVALLHDASEAYLSDIPRPVKQMFPEVKKWEEKVQKCIMDWAGLPYPFPAWIHEADSKVLLDERDVLLSTNTPHRWELDDVDIKGFGFAPYLFCHSDAKKNFLSAWFTLQEIRKKGLPLSLTGFPWFMTV